LLMSQKRMFVLLLHLMCGMYHLCISLLSRYLKTDRTDPTMDPTLVVNQFLSLVTRELS
jgi:hypothetical protein